MILSYIHPLTHINKHTYTDLQKHTHTQTRAATSFLANPWKELIFLWKEYFNYNQGVSWLIIVNI